ncbi:head-tail connector protein [Paenibacillus sp. S-38]|uniref:head-tail connector protein n=1 Tax=Paenibacillus sp. S-38 TaxID=3416710 RepID=UPI003CF53997
MLALDTEELKTYLRVDGSENDGFLALLVHSAKEYLKDAGVPESSSPRYKLAVMIQVALNYDRDGNAAMEKSLESLITQLRVGEASYGGNEPENILEGLGGDGI